MSRMETFLINTGTTRRETLLGRRYIVANATLIVPGVLNGSDGPLLYPVEEVVAEPDMWNHMPIVVGHPRDDEGNQISARSSSVLNKYGIGLVLSAHGEDRLDSELWFDEERTLELVPQVYRALEAGKSIELSTGLKTTKDLAPKGSTWNSIPYTAIARNYKPDHLAILVNEEGACSVRDGCGVNVTNSNEENMKKKDLVTWLTTNCSCWKAKGSAEVLEAMDEKRLSQLKANAVASKLVANATKRIANADGEEATAGVSMKDLAEFLGVQTDAASDPVGFIKELTTAIDAIKAKLGGAAEPEPEPADDAMPADDVALNMDDEEEETPTGNRRRKQAPQRKGKSSMKELLANASDEDRAVWNNAVEIHKAEKLRLVRQLVSNAGITSKVKAKALGDRLMAKNLADLQDMVALIPTANAKKERTAPDNDGSIYLGSAGGTDHTTNTADSADEDDILLANGYGGSDAIDEDEEGEDDDYEVARHTGNSTSRNHKRF